MLLTGRLRLRQLIRERSDKQYRLTQMNREISDLQKYAQHIADGGITMNEMFNTPASIFTRQLMFMNASAQYSQMSAFNMMNMMQANPFYQQMMMQSQNQQYQMAYQSMMYNNSYMQAQKQFAQFEADNLKEKQTQLEEERESIKLDTAAIEAEMKDVKEITKQETQEFARIA